MVYGLREALRAVHDEGLEARLRATRLHGDALRAGLDARGDALRQGAPRAPAPFPDAVVVPEGVDELRVRRRLVEDFGIEIGAASASSRERSGASAPWATRPAPVRAPLPHRARGRNSARRLPRPRGAGLDAALAITHSAGATGSRDSTDNLGATGIGRI